MLDIPDAEDTAYKDHFQGVGICSLTFSADSSKTQLAAASPPRVQPAQLNSFRCQLNP